MSADTAIQISPAARESFWKRRVVTPILAQLKQGVTPEKLALTVALGFTLGIFPILGSCTLLCALAAIVLRLNQPVIQLVNYIAYPPQLALIIPIYQAGEKLFGNAPIPLSIAIIFERFRADFGQFLRDFGMIAVQGIVVWCILAPIIVAAIYFTTRPLLRRLARRTA
ncbi:MAG: DUF2062 domain-containing protein [Chthoniobacteraceae bacterium]